MEWVLSNQRKSQYDNMLNGAQELELNIGSSQVRMYKLLKMREEIDTVLKKWWDEVIKEMGLDPKGDYMISREGLIQDVTKKKETASISTVGSDAAELK
jgi:hypothetical protein